MDGRAARPREPRGRADPARQPQGHGHLGDDITTDIGCTQPDIPIDETGVGPFAIIDAPSAGETVPALPTLSGRSLPGTALTLVVDGGPATSARTLSG